MASPVNVAAPLPTVVAVALLSVAPAGPEAITAVTVTPAPPTALPAASRTWSTGCCPKAAPLVAVGEGSVVIVSWVAVPAPSVMVPEVAGVRLPLSNRSVRSEERRVGNGPRNGAAPHASVVGVALLSVDPGGPDGITAVRVTAAPPTGVPAATRTRSCGCPVKAAPLVAVGDGSVVIVSWVAVPALSVIVPEVAGVRLPLSNRSVELPAAPLSRGRVKWAAPTFTGDAVAQLWCGPRGPAVRTRPTSLDRP